MKRNLKALGLLAFAALAMSAMFAASASAQGGKGVLTIGETDTETPKHTAADIHGEQVGDNTHNYFQVGLDRVTCENEGVTMTGSTETGTEKEITVTPTYHDCYTLNENHEEDRPVTVTMNGCEYVLHQPEALDETDDVWTGNTSLICDGENTPKVEVYQFGSPTSHSFKVCEIDITPFGEHGGNGSKSHYVATVDTDAEVTPGVFRHDITLTATVEGIDVHRSGLCGSAELESTYINTLTVTAASGEKHDDIWISTEAE